MTSLVGIRDINEVLLTPTRDFLGLLPSLKQQLLLFDRIGVIGLDEANSMGIPFDDSSMSEIEWLKENNLLYNMDNTILAVRESEDFLKYLVTIGMGIPFLDYLSESINQLEKDLNIAENMNRFQGNKLKQLENDLSNLMEKENPKSENESLLNKEIKKKQKDIRDELRNVDQFLGQSILKHMSLIARFLAVKTMFFEKSNAVSLIPNYKFSKIPSSRKIDIARLVIKNLPIPDGFTPWEKIIEFRNNTENRAALFGLRRWIRKISTENLTVQELEDELEWLLSEFEHYMKLHKIKSNVSTLEVWVKTPFEMLENLVTLKFSKIADPLFAIKKRNISLMEAELHAPGREVAYILKAREQF